MNTVQWNTEISFLPRMQEIESFATKQKQDKKTIRELEEKITKIQVISLLFIIAVCKT